MVLDLLKNPSFFYILLKLDQESANALQSKGCSHCGGPLHIANYPRKPRGLASDLNADDFAIRYSFCCGHCRQRHTPVSTLFFCRKVYSAAMIVIAAMIIQGATDFRVRALNALGIPKQTIYRWLAWWRNNFSQSQTWQEIKSAFIGVHQLPLDSVNKMQGEDQKNKIVKWLFNIQRISVTLSNWARIAALTQRM